MKNEIDRANTLFGDNISLERKSQQHKQQSASLIDSLEHTTIYTLEEKKRMIDLANLYTQDMEANLFKNQFELASTYSNTTVDEWNDFLRDSIISKYIKKHKNTLLKLTAEDNLATPFARNKRDSLQVLEKMQAEEQNDSKKNVVIMWLDNTYDKD